MSKGVSVVICCYNSSGRLVETLRSLASQDAGVAVPWELILVDNCSTDGTATVARQLWEEEYKAHVPMRIVREERPGLANAREAGILNASFDYILFCDDDNWLHTSYIGTAFRIMESDATIGACGGVGKPVFEDGKGPDWFNQYQMVFACGEQYSKEGYIGADVLTLYGAGMTARRDVLLFIIRHYQFILSDRKGNKLTGGNDYEIVFLIQLLGYRLYYQPSLTFMHYMPAGRMTREYLYRIVEGSALGIVPVFVYVDKVKGRHDSKPVAAVKYIAKIGLEAVKALPRVRKSADVKVILSRFSGNLVSMKTFFGEYQQMQQSIEALKQEYRKSTLCSQ